MPSPRSRLGLALALLCGLACASPTKPTPASPLASPPPSTAARPTVASEPRERPPPPEIDARSPCHPERPNSPQEESLCICERTCAWTIDRDAFARRMIARTGDHEAVARWLRGDIPWELHYPYYDVDGTRITLDRNARVTRCTHSVLGKPSSAVTLECASLDHRHDESPPLGARGTAPVESDRPGRSASRSRVRGRGRMGARPWARRGLGAAVRVFGGGGGGSGVMVRLVRGVRSCGPWNS